MIARSIKESPMLQDGLPDTFVVSNGALKGFVCICPSWYGLTADRLEVASRSVYSEDELEELDAEARIRSGEEHSKMISMSLYDYQVPHSAFFINNTNPSITFSNNGIKFSSSCARRLGNCEYVEILYHPILQTVALRPCEKENPNAVLFKRKNNEMAARGFASAIYKHMGWRRDFKFRFRGIERRRGGVSILLFDLSEPQILVGKGYQSSSESQYISYLEEKDENTFELKSDRGFVAYPAELAGRAVGISYKLKQRIRQIGNEITEIDIREGGIIVSNSMFGDVPERSQMMEEVEKLLAIM